MVNMTCPVEHSEMDPVPFYQDGKLNFKAHDVGWIISGFFALTASVISFWLIWKHLTYYTCPPQQRHIVRMLFMVPIYAVVSWASYFWYREAIYYQTVRDCYEAVVITSFFYLLLQYLADTPAEQLEIFRLIESPKWVWPLGRWKYRPTGLHFLWIMKVCILQYAIVRPVCTMAAVALQYFGYYCLESWMPWFGHVWIAVIISVSVSVAMYCLIQLYMPVAKELKPYSPILKFLAVKSVVFLTFWQDSFLSLLVVFGAIKPAQYMTAPEIQVGINALLQTFEMFIFSLVHIKAFTYLIYRPRDRARTTKRWAALRDAMNFSDWWGEMRATSSYLSAHRKGRDWTYVDDVRRVKYEHLEKALGRERWGELQRERDAKKLTHRSFFRDGGRPDGEGDDDEWTEDLEAVANSSTAAPTVKTSSAQGAKKASSKAGHDAADADKAPSKPRGNRALRGDFDPEKDDGALEEDENQEREAEAQEGQSLLMREPTLPRLGYRPRAAPGADTHPELSWYHGPGRPTAGLEKEADRPHRGLDEEIVKPHRDLDENSATERERRQGSGSLGAWWRTLATRFTGSDDGGRARAEREDDEMKEEKQGMLMTEAREARPATPPRLSPIDSPATTTDIDSPLARFIADSQSEQRSAEEEKRRQLLNALEPSPSTNQIQASEAVLVRQMSVAVSDCVALEQASQSGALQQSPASHPPRPPSSVAASTQQLQQQHLQSQQPRPSSSQARAGPKGRKISLVLPVPLSPEDFRPAAPAVVQQQEPKRTSEIRFADPTRQSERSFATAQAQQVQRSGTTAAPSEMMKASGPKHRVVQGARSLAQVRAEEVAARKAEEQAELEEAREARRRIDEEEKQNAIQAAARRHQKQQQQQQKQQQEQYEAELRRRGQELAQRESPGRNSFAAPPSTSSSNGRSRRTSAPAAPRPSEVMAVQPPTQIEKKWWGKKKFTPAPYTPLPAPSQLATDVGDVQDAFTAAGTTVTTAGVLEQNVPGHRTRRQSTGAINNAGPLHPGVGGSRHHPNPTIEVGAIVSPHAMMDAAWQYQQRSRLPPPQPYPNAPGMPGSSGSQQPWQTTAMYPQGHAYPSPQLVGRDRPHPSQLRPAPRHSAPVTAADSYLYRGGPLPSPQPLRSGSTFGASTPRQSTAGSGFVPLPNPEGRRASYHRYTGEPVWMDGGHPHPSTASGTGTSSSRRPPPRRSAPPQQQRYETREGFSFDYID